MSWECGCGVSNKDTATKCRGCGSERTFEVCERLAETPKEGERRELAKKRFKSLQIFLVVSVVALAGVMLMAFKVIPESEVLGIILTIPLIVGSWGSAIMFAKLAGMLGKSRIAWFFLPGLTAPFGLVIGYFSIKDSVQNLIKGRS